MPIGVTDGTQTPGTLLWQTSQVRVKLSFASASRSWVATFLTSALKLPVALSPASANVVAGALGAAAQPPSRAAAASAINKRAAMNFPPAQIRGACIRREERQVEREAVRRPGEGWGARGVKDAVAFEPPGCQP